MKSLFCRVGLLASLPWWAALALAQTQGSTTATHNVAPASLSQVSEEPYPLAEGLVRELRKGGYTLFLAHPELKPGREEAQAGEWWKDCFLTRGVTEGGLETAKLIGASIKRLGIPIQEIRGSEFCRSLNTGSALGIKDQPPRGFPALNSLSAQASAGKKPADSAKALRALLAMPPMPAANLILIGDPPDGSVSPDPMLTALRPGEVAIFKAMADGKLSFLTRLSPRQWPSLAIAGEAETRPAANAAPANPGPVVLIQSSTAQTATATYSVTPQAPQQVPDEPYALAEGLVRELRKGGYILFLHHGAVLPGTDLHGKGEWWRNCATTQKLAPQTIPQIQAIGGAINRQRIMIDQVQTSEFCRAADTGLFLGLTAPQQLPALNPLPAFQAQKKSAADLATGLQALLSTPPPAGRNRVLVGHTPPPGAGHPALGALLDGQTAIFRPDSNGHFHYITTLSPGQWQWIAKLSIADLPAQVAGAAPVPLPPPPPFIDPAKELKGVALVTALRKGGYNLYMRHALSTMGADQDLLKTPMWWENCAIQRNISEPGREQARKVGAAIRELKIPIGAVKVAQFCRTRDTGNLMGLGPLEIEEGLNHVIGQRVGFDVNAARFKLLTEAPPKGKNNILVSHTHGSPHPEERIMGGLSEAEIAVYHPDGKGNVELLARINLAEWDNLNKLMSATKP